MRSILLSLVLALSTVVVAAPRPVEVDRVVTVTLVRWPYT